LEFLFLFLLPLLLDEEYVGVEGGLLLAVPLGDSGPEGWTRARRIWGERGALYLDESFIAQFTGFLMFNYRI
jgi:hypothetical protein